MAANSNIENVLLTVEHYKASMADFRHAVVHGKYHGCSFFSRVLAWKACYLTQTLKTPRWAERLRNSRLVFRDLRQNPEMKPPWWTLDSDCDLYLSQTTSVSSSSSSRAGAKNTVGSRKLHRVPIDNNPLSDPLSDPDPHPLSLGPELTAEESADLLRSVVMDVQRLFPGEGLFHDGSAAAVRRKRHVVAMLYVWAKCNPHVGYKQGMHEILGLIYLNMAREAVEMPSSGDASYSAADRSILALFDSHYLQHDVFALFNRFVGSSGAVAQFYLSEKRLMDLIAAFDALLMKVDQLVHYNLVTKLRLEPQLWIIRYLRLLLARELGPDMEQLSRLWDRLMAADLLLPQCLPNLVLFLVVVLLVRIKSELMVCDFSEALTLLLRYPIGEKIQAHACFLDLLFNDAYDLYQNRDNDLKLYEHGLRLARKAGTGVSVLYLRPTTPILSPRLSAETSIPTAEATRATNMAFEKTRLEMRLKKKAQLMVRQ